MGSGPYFFNPYSRFSVADLAYLDKRSQNSDLSTLGSSHILRTTANFTVCTTYTDTISVSMVFFFNFYFSAAVASAVCCCCFSAEQFSNFCKANTIAAAFFSFIYFVFDVISNCVLYKHRHAEYHFPSTVAIEIRSCISWQAICVAVNICCFFSLGSLYVWYLSIHFLVSVYYIFV